MNASEVFDRITQELEGHFKTDGTYQCSCPCLGHEDKNPSCNIKLSGDKILAHCFVCGEGAAGAALRDRGLWPTTDTHFTPRPHRSNPQPHTPIKKTLPPGIPQKRETKDKQGNVVDTKFFKDVWTYKDVAGKIIGYAVRYENEKGKDVASFFKKRQHGGWYGGAPKIPRPLYGLNLIHKAPKDLTIWIVEGEKCAEAMQRVRRLATASLGGTSVADRTDWSPLAGRKVRIWPDYDKPGKKYAAAVKLQLESLMPPPTIEMVDVAKLGLESTGDAFDWLQMHDKDELDGIALVNKSPAEQDVFVDVQEFVLMDLPAIEMVMDPWLPTQGLCMIHAKRGTGKTLITCEIAYAIASGNKFLNWEAPKPRGVLYVDGEMSATELQERFVRIIANHAGQGPAKTLRLYAAGLNIHGTPNIGTIEGQERINKGITDDIELIIIDSLSVLQRGCDENKSVGWEPMQNWLLQLRGLGKAVLLIHHSGKSGEQRGASKREDFMNTVISLKEHAIYSQEEGAKFEVRFEKGRNLYGPKARSIDVEFIGTDWIYKDMKGAVRDQIIMALKDNVEQKEIASALKVSQPYVSKIKKEAQFNGEL